MRCLLVPALLSLALTASGGQVDPLARDREMEKILGWGKDRSEAATARLKERLKADDLHVSLCAALILAGRGDRSGLDVLVRAAGADREALRGFEGPHVVNDPRVDALMAIERFDRGRAFDLYLTYLDGLREIERDDYYAGLANAPGPWLFYDHTAVSRVCQLAKDARKEAWLVGRFTARFRANPADYNAASLYVGVLSQTGQAEKTVDVWLAHIESSSLNTAEATIRKINFRWDEARSPDWKQRSAAACRDLLKLDAAGVEELQRISKKHPYAGLWLCRSLDEFREGVRFRLAGCLPPNEAVEVYKEIFAANPKAEYGGSIVDRLNGAFIEADPPHTDAERLACYANTVRLYAAALEKSPGDRQLRLLYLRAVLSAQMADEGRRVLTQMLASPDRRERYDAIWWIKEYYRLEAGARARDAIAMYSRALDDPDASIRKEAASWLGQLYHPPKEAETALEKATKDPDREVKERAASSLRNLRWVTGGKTPGGGQGDKK